MKTRMNGTYLEQLNKNALVKRLSKYACVITVVALLSPCLTDGKILSLPVAYADGLKASAGYEKETVVNVRDFGAKGDGIADDTDAIQKAIDFMAGTGGKVYIPDGTYMINAIRHGQRAGLMLKSNLTIQMQADAVLKAIPNSKPSYAILYASGVSNVNIVGGTLQGERYKHTPDPEQDPGEYGMGLDLHDNCQNIHVKNVIAKEFWGDGFFVGGWTETLRNITFDNVTADLNRRQGISVLNVDGLKILNSRFTNTSGTLPESGIDFEPEENDVIKNVEITGCTFAGNSGNGLLLCLPPLSKGTAIIKGMKVSSCSFYNNGSSNISPKRWYGIYMLGYMPNNPSKMVRISDVEFSNIAITKNWGGGIAAAFTENLSMKNSKVYDNGSVVDGKNKGFGVIFDRGINGIFSGNEFRNNKGNGYYQYQCQNSQVTGNLANGNTGYGILSSQCTGGSISNNNVYGNGIAP